MDSEEQKDFVRELMSGMAEDICTQIERGKIPRDWDGLELRELIARKADWNRAPTMKARNSPRRKVFDRMLIALDL